MKCRAILKYVAAVVLFGSNGIVASHIATSSPDIVLNRTGIGEALSPLQLAGTLAESVEAPER